MAWHVRAQAPRRVLLALLVVSAVAAAMLAFGSSPAWAICGLSHSYTVDWGNDEGDGGSAVGPDGKLSLQEAIDAANNDSGRSTIVLPARHYFISDGLPVTDTCGLTIQGAGARVTVIDGTNSDYVFGNTGTATIDGVTITGGKSTGGGLGGALTNNGELTLTNDAIIGNTAPAGGGILNQSGHTLMVSGSTFSGNSATGTGTPQGGGAINNNGSATIANSTISGNTAVAFGGGVFTDTSGVTTL